jgi:hypothetical protein
MGSFKLSWAVFEVFVADITCPDQAGAAVSKNKKLS